MKPITTRFNNWKKVYEAKCNDCGARVEIKPALVVKSVAKTWGHSCSGYELEGMKVRV